MNLKCGKCRPPRGNWYIWYMSLGKRPNLGVFSILMWVELFQDSQQWEGKWATARTNTNIQRPDSGGWDERRNQKPVEERISRRENSQSNKAPVSSRISTARHSLSLSSWGISSGLWWEPAGGGGGGWKPKEWVIKVRIWRHWVFKDIWVRNQ